MQRVAMIVANIMVIAFVMVMVAISMRFMAKVGMRLLDHFLKGKDREK